MKCGYSLHEKAVSVDYQTPEERMKILKLPARPPELIAIEDRRAALRAERQEVEAELARLTDEAWNASQPNVDPLDAAAERLAAGEIETASRDALPEEVEILRSRLDLLQRAETKLANRVAEQRERHNRAVAGIHRPEHKKAAHRIARALRELVSANAEEELLRDRAPGGQLPAMNFPGIGSLGAAGGAAKFWFDHARRHGYLDEDESILPAAAF